MLWMSVYLLICLLAVLLYGAFFGKKVLPYMAVQTAWFGWLFRSRGEGFLLLLPGESITYEVPTKNRSFEVVDEFETASGKKFQLTIRAEYHPWFLHLQNFLSFGEGDVDASFKEIETNMGERLLAIAVAKIRRAPNPEEVMNYLPQLAGAIKKKFENTPSEDGLPLQQYYGCNLKSVYCVKPTLSKEKQEAINKLDAQETENKVREIANRKTSEMAKEIVEESKALHPNDPSKWMGMKEAMEFIQTNEKIAVKTIHKVEFEADEAALGIGAILVNKFFGGKKHGRRKS